MDSPEAIAVFLANAFETGDAVFIGQALEVAGRAKGMVEVARKAGLSRERLYCAFNSQVDLTLKTLLAITKALGWG